MSTVRKENYVLPPESPVHIFYCVLLLLAVISKSLLAIHYHKVIENSIKDAGIMKFFKSIVKYVIIKLKNKELKPNLKFTSASPLAL